MIRQLTFLSLAVLLCTARFAMADAYDNCRNDCNSTQTQCIEGITLYDPTGIKEAKAACDQDQVACIKKCHEIEDLGVEGYQEKLKRESGEGEQKDQDGVKLYAPNM